MDDPPGAKAGALVGRILADMIYYVARVGTAIFSLKFLTKILAKNTIKNISKNTNQPQNTTGVMETTRK
jgi:hypothetical protein